MIVNTDISKFIADSKFLWIVKFSTNGNQLLKDLISLDKWARR